MRAGKLILLQLGLAATLWGHAQPGPGLATDQLRMELSKVMADSSRARLHYDLGGLLLPMHPDSARKEWELALAAVDRALRKEPADSLNLLRIKGDALNNIGIAMDRLGDYAGSLRSYNASERLRRRLNDRLGLLRTLASKAVLLRKQSDPKAALDANVEGLELARELGQPRDELSILLNMALLFQTLGLSDVSASYYQQARTLAIKTDDPAVQGRILNGMGGLFQAGGQLDSALHYYSASLQVREGSNDLRGIATACYNMASVHLDRSEPGLARPLLERAISIRRTLSDRSGLVSALAQLAAVDLSAGAVPDAIGNGRMALELALGTGNLNDKQVAARVMYRAYKEAGQALPALEMFELYSACKDSIGQAEDAQDLLREKFRMDLENDSILHAREREVDRLNLVHAETRSSMQRMVLIVMACALIAIALLAWSVHAAKRRSERLLLNILPAPVAEELKRKGRYSPVRHPQVTVIFTDVVDFISYSEGMEPEALVSEMDRCFSEFDRIIERYGLEKIKTIGDAYMAVSGLANGSMDHAMQAAQASLEMIRAMNDLRAERNARGGNWFRIRVGLHSGPVVAGIVGLRKFQYDVWGSTVNLAARLESASMPDRINISEATRKLLGERVRVVHRGALEVKGRRELEMYFLEGLVGEGT